ncbi:deaminase reductase [Knoellia flava TL1]|uniref:DNA-binding protein n=2 Tax=Knoellia flava TaxID=913969 RepID=A0A8H9FUB8_9MICO|nr:dihydrofolate reductase family protein [Knoellia flava]KGN33526.1 deaminase reductase [Knoellia flava TL1]GGB73463.1 DNA-binding protein [Knoellia flava]
MSLVRVTQFSVSLDGFSTGEGQSLESPFGHAGSRLMDWFGATRLGRQVHDDDAPARRGIDDALVSSGWDGSVGVEIMGRGKFGPQTGPWTDDRWRGWWGDNPPFHTPVFVLTHHPRPPLEMEGGTTFHFVDGTPEDVLAQAREAAGGLDVRIGGGPSTVRQFLAAGLVNLMHVALVPIVLGRGVSLWEGLEGVEDGFDIETVHSPTSGVTHLLFQRKEG